MGFFKRLFGRAETRGPSLPLELARRGWIPHRFPKSNVVVFLPEGVVAAHDPEGVLIGSTNAKDVEFSATLHGGFEQDRADALHFLAHMAQKRGLKVQNFGTYSYFFDPTDAPPTAKALRFWVIGVPGAVVVVSISCEGDKPVSPLLQEVKQQIPQIIGELL